MCVYVFGVPEFKDFTTQGRSFAFTINFTIMAAQKQQQLQPELKNVIKGV